jgi:hypothetical protein
MPGDERESGRRTFDKTVSSKPLAFAADAGLWVFNAGLVRRYWVGRRICGVKGLTVWMADHGGETKYCRDFGAAAGNGIG